MQLLPVVSGTLQYPVDLVKELSQLPIKLYSLDAVELASQAGNVKTANIILVGVLASITEIPKEMWEEAITETVPEKFLHYVS